MKRTGSRYRSRRPSAVGMSLFPFLAVLICTMGSLILLLVVITRQAKLQAAQLAAAEADKQKKELKEAREEVQWKIELLKTSREKTRLQLAEARLELGGIEDHARRLTDRFVRLKATLAELNRTDGDGGRRREELESELRQVRAEIAEVAGRLDQVRQNAEHRRRSYAVVPYRGPHETLRRPIYIECTADSIILQPEGIVLRKDDFDGPMGPGNPLAAMLRAVREYLLDCRDFDPIKAGEPYPLLLVRQGSIGAYYAARSAMKSWGSEFGYELIGDDWRLEFPPPDLELAEAARRAVEAARRRRDRLAAAAPRHYTGRSPTRYRASRIHGGIVPDGGLLDEVTNSEQPFSRRRHGDVNSDQSFSRRRDGDVNSDQEIKSLASSRGTNWGLPDASNASVPITRPIRVECHSDRLVIVPERGLAGGKTIPLGPRTELSIDEFVSAVWEYLTGWGIAGRGMY